MLPGHFVQLYKNKKFSIRPGQNRVFAAYQLRGLLQNRQRRRKEVHKMFTFQAGQNRIFTAYQVGGLLQNRQRRLKEIHKMFTF